VPLSCNLGTLTSWNPLGHSRPVTGLLYLYQVNTVRPACGMIGHLHVHFRDKHMISQDDKG
jgi:hypothetical protein